MQVLLAHQVWLADGPRMPLTLPELSVLCVCMWRNCMHEDKARCVAGNLLPTQIKHDHTCMLKPSLHMQRVIAGRRLVSVKVLCGCYYARRPCYAYRIWITTADCVIPFAVN